jgi:hypothetical protein
MSKEIQIEHIILELRKFPEDFLPNLHRGIVNIRKQLGAKPRQGPKNHEETIWDELVQEIYGSRKQNNEALKSRLEKLSIE